MPQQLATCFDWAVRQLFLSAGWSRTRSRAVSQGPCGDPARASVPLAAGEASLQPRAFGSHLSRPPEGLALSPCAICHNQTPLEHHARCPRSCNDLMGFDRAGAGQQRLWLR